MPTVAAPLSTRQRLLEGAAAVFAREGLRGATTREIALAAGVNEVTLFRLFQNKQRLLTAVIEHVFAEAAPAGAPPKSLSVRETLRDFAERYLGRLRRNFDLVRVLLGEIQHSDAQDLQVIREVFRPQRQELISALHDAQTRGEIRPEADLAIITDQLCGIIFTGALKSALPLPREYGLERYLEEAVETICRALQATTAVKPPRAAKRPSRS